jgi:cyanophycin synthetase
MLALLSLLTSDEGMTMEFRKVLALRGPNIWASFPVLEAWLDLGALKDSSSDELPGFNDRLMSWLPSLVEHRCSIGTRGGFFERLRRGTYQGHILEHVALELQTLAGTEVGFGRTRETSTEGVYKVVIEYEAEELGRACLESARNLCLAAVHDLPFDVPAEVDKLRTLAERVRLKPTQAALIRAARKRKIPIRHLDSEDLLLLGHGWRQRRILGGQTDRTGAPAESIAHDNELTRTLLAAAGVPVPEGRRLAGAEDAWAAAQELGLPVTIRPRYGHDEQALARSLTTRDQVLAAYEMVRGKTASILVERSAPGTTHRLLVVGERVAAALHLETGADVTARVHPEVAARAVDAAAMIGIDVAGIDVTARDISRPLEEQEGVVTAVHARPDLDMHLAPASGSAQPVGEAIINHLFPECQTGRIPIVAVTGVNGKTTTTRLIAHVVGLTHEKGDGPPKVKGAAPGSAGHRCIGMTCTEGIFIDGRRIEAGDCSGPQSARAVLQHPRVEAAVLETARGGILREGLGFDRCDVAVVTNVAEGDHLGVADVETPEQLARVKRTLVEAVAPSGTAVLRADDPLVAVMASHCPGAVVFFAQDGNHLVITRHRSARGRAAFVRDSHIVLVEGEQEIPLIGLDLVPLTHGGRIGFQVENALAAAAAAWSLGVPCEVIRVGLESFSGDLQKVPGRFNLLEVNRATVILDYGHNASALACLIDVIEQFPHRRRLAVYSTAGDRRDCDLIRQGQLLGGAFDHVILYEDHYLRGRKKGEIMALFRQGLAVGNRVEDIQEVRGAVKAIETALHKVRPGELLLLQADTIDETIDFVQRHLVASGVGREIDLCEALALSGQVTETVTCSPSGNGSDHRERRRGKSLFAS